MMRDIFTNKWIIGAAFVLLIVITGCILYYQQTTQTDKQAAEQADKLLLEWKANKAKTPTTAETKETNTSAESTTPTAEKPLTTDAGVTTKPEAKQAQSAALAQTEAADVRVSKFGFGPYPELPADFPWQDLFDPPYYTEDPKNPYKDEPDYELMDRVYVELWKRGENVVGMGTRESTGLFYPTIRGTIYVEWGPRWKIYGLSFGRKVRHITGHPDDLEHLRSLQREGKPITARDISSDLKVLDMSEGIDPFKFLNLPK